MDKNEILNMPIGKQMDWKFGLVTRTVYRKSKNIYYIDDTSSGWVTATVTYDKMVDLLDGKLSMLDLNWK